MNISIIGTGYVGLVTGACFAELGYRVKCLDRDYKKLKELKYGKVSFYEPFLEEIVKNNLSNQRLSFTDSYEEAASSQIIFVCVDTPSDINGDANLDNFWSAIKSIGQFLGSKSIIVLKSTVPLGTNAKVNEYFKKNMNKASPIICSNPEFLKEGSAINDFLRPDRIIIGSNHKSASSLLEQLYEPLNRKSNKLIFMNPESAELVKYASNSFLATKISFINQISRVCESIGGDINSVRKGMGSDKRIGKDFLYAGIGFGGSCFPKDISVLQKELQKLNISQNILEATIKANDQQLIHFKDKILNYFANEKVSLKSIVFTIWGASFKPNTSDVRESQAIKLIKDIAKEVKRIYVYDPVVNSDTLKNEKLPKNVSLIENMYTKIDASHGLIICTEWKEFWHPDPKILQNLKFRVIFDGRNILNKESLSEFNIKYFGVGC